MSKAFLSHSSKDKELVRRIATELGDQCILDEISFEPGRKTLDEIFRTMAESDIFVLFISGNSLDSPWVKQEITRSEKLSSEKLTHVLPLVIDPTISHEDKRIPDWLAKPYNLRYISNVKIILQKIENALRKINVLKFPRNQELMNLFVGRNDEIARFEFDINNLDNWMPTYVVAYNYFAGIGRRTFLMNALKKVNLLDVLHRPTFISIDAKESVENFIYKLNSIHQEDDIWHVDLSRETIERKVSIAIDLVKEFYKVKEIIFIVDDGGIVLPNHDIVDWFKQIVADEYFHNRLVFCVVSQNRPNEQTLREEHLALWYRIPELTKEESKSLFIRLLNVYHVENLSKEYKQYFLDKLGGIPSQINYAVQLIKDNPVEAKIHANDIVEFSDRFCHLLLDNVKKNDLAYQVSLLLSKEEIISLTLIYRIFGETKETNEALQFLYDFSCFNYLQGDCEFVKLNPTMADFMRRSRLELCGKYRTKYKNVLRQLLEENLDELLEKDYSQFMLTIQQMLQEKKRIPDKYFMPSLIIKNVIREYDRGHYSYVITLCTDLLKNSNYDEQILWETRYRLTLAYARTRDSRFLESVKSFWPTNKFDYNFLMGFYYRHNKDASKALEYYDKALEISPDNSRTKREKVNVLLSLERYEDALEMARENYEHRRGNIFHTQSYFIALIRKQGIILEKEKTILRTLMEEVHQSDDSKAIDIYRCMKGEYMYYVDHDTINAIKQLRDAMKENENSVYPIKSLMIIYKRTGQFAAFEELRDKLSNMDDN
ncbi:MULTISPECIES: toll/interleukin-1 receptor domain-containing protein [Butyricimonas]|uniref:toll/interleukin-1 receptor domain-containing protein n=1 Tax=Butyricimonas TaxID=574697 RepID=UPI0007FB2D2B|nr:MULTISPECIES: toll/interleukin-1 receptor domain-containing protein [Butyricimonas]